MGQISDFNCPLCGGEEVRTLGQRVREECVSCSSKARTRASFLALRTSGAFDSGYARVLLISPSRSLAKYVASRTDSLYVTAVDPLKLKLGSIRAVLLDLEDIGQYAPFDYVVHNHFLDTIRDDFSKTIARLDALIRPGGWHIFTVPVRGSTTEEIEADSDETEREERFGNAGRYRTFGADDVIPILREFWSADRILFPLNQRYTKQDLFRYGLTPRHFDRPHSNTVFARQAVPG